MLAMLKQVTNSPGTAEAANGGISSAESHIACAVPRYDGDGNLEGSMIYLPNPFLSERKEDYVEDLGESYSIISTIDHTASSTRYWDLRIHSFQR